MAGPRPKEIDRKPPKETDPMLFLLSFLLRIPSKNLKVGSRMNLMETLIGPSEFSGDISSTSFRSYLRAAKK